jgi:hypothetical protein
MNFIQDNNVNKENAIDNSYAKASNKVKTWKTFGIGNL